MEPGPWFLFARRPRIKNMKFEDFKKCEFISKHQCPFGKSAFIIAWSVDIL
jgi:hypothetical protein